MSGNQKSHCAISPAAYVVRAPGPAADTPAATAPPDRSTSGSSTANRSAARSPSPASSGTPATPPESAARTRPPPTPPAPADTAAAHHWPTPASPYSSRFPAPLHLRNRHSLRPAQPADLRPILHAQHTRSLPSSTPARVSGKLVNFQLPPHGQYWTAVDTSPSRRRTGRSPPTALHSESVSGVPRPTRLARSEHLAWPFGPPVPPLAGPADRRTRKQEAKRLVYVARVLHSTYG